LLHGAERVRVAAVVWVGVRIGQGVVVVIVGFGRSVGRSTIALRC
jgi:hypothetical protein